MVASVSYPELEGHPDHGWHANCCRAVAAPYSALISREVATRASLLSTHWTCFPTLPTSGMPSHWSFTRPVPPTTAWTVPPWQAAGISSRYHPFVHWPGGSRRPDCRPATGPARCPESGGKGVGSMKLEVCGAAAYCYTNNREIDQAKGQYRVCARRRHGPLGMDPRLASFCPPRPQCHRRRPARARALPGEAKRVCRGTWATGW